MLEKELKEEAKTRYPIGSKIKSLSGDSFVLGGHHFTFHDSNKTLGASSEITRQILYDNGNWAEIEEFVKAWCIKVTKENHEELGKWREAGQVGDMESGNKANGYILSEYHGARGYFSQTKPSNMQEITTEQFKKYVLNYSDAWMEKYTEKRKSRKKSDVEVINRKTITLWE